MTTMVSLPEEVCQHHGEIRMVVGEPGVGEIGPEDPPEDLKCYQKGSLQSVLPRIVADDGFPDLISLPERLEVALYERGGGWRYQEYLLLLLHLSPSDVLNGGTCNSLQQACPTGYNTVRGINWKSIAEVGYLICERLEH